MSSLAPVPTDFDTQHSKVGLKINTTGASPVKIYMDAISFEN